MDKYYIIRNKETGFYFRGKGANRWGKYHNQASIYRMKAHAENSLAWLLRHGEQSEIVPIQIVENPTDIAEVVRCEVCEYYSEDQYGSYCNLHSAIESEDYPAFQVPMLSFDFCSYGERKTND